MPLKFLEFVFRATQQTTRVPKVGKAYDKITKTRKKIFPFSNFSANIDPFLKIYNKCDDPEGKVSETGSIWKIPVGKMPKYFSKIFQKGYRRITLRYPRGLL
jgi:hypothetical protein